MNNKRPVAPIRQQKEEVKLHYTVTPIGGTAELEAWKLSQAHKQIEWEAKRAKAYGARRDNAIEMVKDQDSNPFKWSTQEASEVMYRQRLRAEARRKAECMSLEEPTQGPYPVATPVPEDSLVSKIGKFVSKLLRK